jgi:hypothetical protein
LGSVSFSGWSLPKVSIAEVRSGRLGLVGVSGLSRRVLLQVTVRSRHMPSSDPPETVVSSIRSTGDQSDQQGVNSRGLPPGVFQPSSAVGAIAVALAILRTQLLPPRWTRRTTSVHPLPLLAGFSPTRPANPGQTALSPPWRPRTDRLRCRGRPPLRLFPPFPAAVGEFLGGRHASDLAKLLASVPPKLSGSCPGVASGLSVGTRGFRFRGRRQRFDSACWGHAVRLHGGFLAPARALRHTARPLWTVSLFEHPRANCRHIAVRELRNPNVQSTHVGESRSDSGSRRRPGRLGVCVGILEFARTNQQG